MGGVTHKNVKELFCLVTLAFYSCVCLIEFQVVVAGERDTLGLKGFHFIGCAVFFVSFFFQSGYSIMVLIRHIFRTNVIYLLFTFFSHSIKSLFVRGILLWFHPASYSGTADFYLCMSSTTQTLI